MNTDQYKLSWNERPDMRPMYVLVKNVTRGGIVHKKGQVVYGFDDRNTFVVPFNGNISLPLAAVKFTGYGDANKILRETFR